MNLNMTTSMPSLYPEGPAPPMPEDVIEIGLLLPSKRAVDLLKLAQDRQISVGQLLRKLIDRELAGPF